MKYKYFYVHIPRTAGGSLTWAFRGAGIEGFKRIGHNTYNPEWKNYSVLKKKFPEREFFTIIRNPYDRFISAYNCLRYNATNKNDKIISKKYLQPYKDINDFVKNGLKKVLQTDNPHFKPQVFYLGWSTEEISILPYEHPEALRDYLGSFLDQDLQKVYPLFKANKIHVQEKKEFELDKESKKIIAEVYDEDFKLLGYEK